MHTIKLKMCFNCSKTSIWSCWNKWCIWKYKRMSSWIQVLFHRQVYIQYRKILELWIVLKVMLFFFSGRSQAIAWMSGCSLHCSGGSSLSTPWCSHCPSGFLQSWHGQVMTSRSLVGWEKVKEWLRQHSGRCLGREIELLVIRLWLWMVCFAQ